MADGRAVFLHIGAPKTGTTYLQQLLWRNREALARDGVCYPLADPDEHFRAAVDLRELPWGGEPHPEYAGTWETVAQRAASWPGRSVLSNELLAAATSEQIRRGLDFFDGAEVHVVYTLRDLARMLPSDWQEQVKHRHPLSWADYVRDVVDAGSDTEVGAWFWSLHDAPVVLARWAAEVSPQRVHVVIGPRETSAPEELWHRFAALLGVQPDEYDTGSGPANVSLGQLQTELLQRVNARVVGSDLEPRYDEVVGGVLIEQVLRSGGDDSRVRLPTTRQDWLARRSKDVVDALTGGGYDVVGNVNDLLVRPEADSATPADPSVSASLDVAADVVTELLRHLGELNDELGRLRAATPPDDEMAGPQPAEEPRPPPEGERPRPLLRKRRGRA